MAKTPIIYGPHPNTDETISEPARFIGNFHKTLPHDQNGHVVRQAYENLSAICTQAAGYGDFETVVPGPISDPNQAPFKKQPKSGEAAKLNNPMAGRATDLSGPDPLHMEMQPAPGVLSASTAAEFTELYWMALLRDEPFERWPAPSGAPISVPKPSSDFDLAIQDLTTAFSSALSDTSDAGRLQLVADLPEKGGGLDLTPQTLFRCGLPKEHFGPLVSQFLLQDFAYGAQLIEQTLVPYALGVDYLTDRSKWLLAQNTGYDIFGHDYGSCNNFGDDKGAYPPILERRHIASMRDLARFVNRDALHQAYFNAALQLLNWGLAETPDNPYRSTKRQMGFGTLGGPNLLALVSEVASRALKVVWRQKWMVHRRLRPEAYGGLLEMQRPGDGSAGIPYGLPDWVFETQAAKRFVPPDGVGARFLPLAYSAGSPTHPSYGAGHATVAGACVTILKAWFQDVGLAALIDSLPPEGKDPGGKPQILQPGSNSANAPLAPYSGPDRADMTVHGELNKLAANVAMGRSMGGVHFRSDNTRSLRLGERVATIMLSRLASGYAERPLGFAYRNFDGDDVKIDSRGNVEVAGHPELEAFYSRA